MHRVIIKLMIWTFWLINLYYCIYYWNPCKKLEVLLIVCLLKIALNEYMQPNRYLPQKKNTSTNIIK